MLERTPFACDADRGAFVLASSPEIVEYWTFEGDDAPVQIETDRSRVVAVGLLPSGDVLTVHQMGEVAAWSPRDEEQIEPSWTLDLELEPCAFAAHGPPTGPADRVALGARRGHILLLEPDQQAPEPTRLEGHDADITELVFDDTGERLASAGRDHAIQIWSATAGEGDAEDETRDETKDQTEGEPEGHPPLHRLEGSESWPLTLRFSHGGEHLASSALDNALYLWRPDADDPLQTTASRHHNWITDLAWSADDTRIATGSWDASAGLFGGDALEPHYRLEAHTDFVSSVAFWGDDRLVTAGYDGLLCIWNWRDGSLAHQIDAHPNWIERLVVLDDRALTLSSDGLIREWDPDRGQQTAEYGDPGVGAFDLGKEVDFSDYVDVPELPSDVTDEAAVDIPDPEVVRRFDKERLEEGEEETADAVSLLEHAVETSTEGGDVGETAPESKQLEPGSGDVGASELGSPSGEADVTAESNLETSPSADPASVDDEADGTSVSTTESAEEPNVDEEIEASVDSFDQDFDDRVEEASLDVSADLDLDEKDESDEEEADGDEVDFETDESVTEAVEEATEAPETGDEAHETADEEPSAEALATGEAETDRKSGDDGDSVPHETMMSGGPVAPSEGDQKEASPEAAASDEPSGESAGSEEDATATSGADSGIPSPDDFEDPQARSDVDRPEDVDESIEEDEESKLADDLVSSVIDGANDESAGADQTAEETDEAESAPTSPAKDDDRSGETESGTAVPAPGSEQTSASSTQQGIGAASTGAIGAEGETGGEEAGEAPSDRTEPTSAQSTHRGGPVHSGEAEGTPEAGTSNDQEESAQGQSEDSEFSKTDTRLGLKAENQEADAEPETAATEKNEAAGEGPDLDRTQFDVEVVSIEELWSRRNEHRVADGETSAAGGSFRRREVFHAADGTIDDTACRSGSPLVAVTSDGTVDLWNRGGEHLTRLPSANDDVSTIAFSRLGRALFGAGEAGNIDVWLLPEEPGSGSGGTAVRAVLEGHEAPITSLTTTPDGEWVMSGDARGNARIWRLRDGAAPIQLESEDDALADVAYGDFPVTASRRGVIAYWDAEGRQIRSHDTGWELSVADARGTNVAWGAESGDVALHSGGPPSELTAHDGEVTGLGMTPEGDLLSSGTDGRVFVYGPDGESAAQRLECPEPIRALDTSSRLVVAGDETGYVHLFARS